ncbi:hypothetical protein [Phaeodactylibacter luteus]|uniref:Uncharacterized protein n=1 Tax=Phaeodactylibacter luteus TaxID=1564516 RepID=A0A5C6RL16_9BACT|nr:hypothetical protein [Phaeodactylibacter luteus]TXB62644.1 hypothetical protein FRY97_12955 [Phaeodactylibacter luteus]
MSALDIIRPRFQQEVLCSAEQLIERFRTYLKSPPEGVDGVVLGDHVVLRIPVGEQHYWSPQLSLTFEQQEEQTLIRGLYGPRSSVWLMFVFLYSTLGAISLFVSITGFSQLSLGIAAPVLWVLPVAGVLALLLFFSAKAGERLGRAEMHRLRGCLLDILAEVPCREAIGKVL